MNLDAIIHVITFCDLYDQIDIYMSIPKIRPRLESNAMLWNVDNDVLEDMISEKKITYLEFICMRVPIIQSWSIGDTDCSTDTLLGLMIVEKKRKIVEILLRFSGNLDQFIDCNIIPHLGDMYKMILDKSSISSIMDTDVIRSLLETNDIRYIDYFLGRNGFAETLLNEAVRYKSSRVEYIVSKMSKAFIVENTENALHMAILMGQYDMVYVLLKARGTTRSIPKKYMKKLLVTNNRHMIDLLICYGLELTSDLVCLAAVHANKGLYEYIIAIYHEQLGSSDKFSDFPDTNNDLIISDD